MAGCPSILILKSQQVRFGLNLRLDWALCLLVQAAELEKQARIDADKSLQARREVLGLCNPLSMALEDREG